MFIRLESALLAAACVLGIGNCNLPTACDCGPTGASITIPEVDAADIAGVAITGPCTLGSDEVGPLYGQAIHDETDPNSEQAKLAEVVPSAERTVHVEATANGVCRLEIAFHSDRPPFVVDLRFRFIEGDCCIGYYAVGPRQVEVPAQPALDAGGDEPAVEDDAGIGRVNPR